MKARSRHLVTWISLVPLALLAGGCAPSIDDLSVGTGEPGERLDVRLELTKNQTTIDGVELETRPVGGSFSAAGSLAGSAGTYTGRTPRLGAGDHEARVNVHYRRLFLPGVRTKSATRSFSLGWPDGTFHFDAGLAGWGLQGVLGTSEAFQPCDSATLTSSPRFSVSTAGWPVGINDTNPGFPSGSLRVLVDDACYPDAEDEVTETFWQINLVSPPLTGQTDWQGIDGVSFRMIGNIPVQAMATVVHLDAAGDEAYASPMLDGSLDFAEIGNGWTIVERTGYVPQDATIQRILIRVFGEPGWVANLGEPATLLLDVVQPMRDEGDGS